jgi:hypothetical protein
MRLDICRVLVIREIYAIFQSRKLNERVKLGDLGTDRKNYVKMYLKVIGFEYILARWRYLLGLQTTPLYCLQSFIADSTSRCYNHSITVDSDPSMSCVGVVY